jgi:hypothetical protein
VAAVRAPRVESGGSGRKAKQQYRRALDTRRGGAALRDTREFLARAMMGTCRFRGPRDADLRGARASTDRRLHPPRRRHRRRRRPPRRSAAHPDEAPPTLTSSLSALTDLE